VQPIVYSLSVADAYTTGIPHPSVLAKLALEAKLVSEAWTIAAEFGSIAGLDGIGVFQNEVDAYSWPGTTGGGVGVGVGEGLGVGVEVGLGGGTGLGVAHALRH
jgi:hypothetical protein